MKNVQIDVKKNLPHKMLVFIGLIIDLFLVSYLLSKFRFSTYFLSEALLLGTTLGLILSSLSYYIKKVTKIQIYYILFEILILIGVIISLYFIFFKYPIKEYYEFIEAFLKVLIILLLVKSLFYFLFPKFNYFFKIFVAMFLPVTFYLVYLLLEKI